MLRTIASVLVGCAVPSVSLAQTVGPDMVNSNLVDVFRYGTDAAGTTTAYAIGSTTCNHGDVGAVVWPSGSEVRPLVGQNIYRLKTDPGGFQRMEQLGQSWVKKVEVPGQGNNVSCGTCMAAGASMMGPGCADVYSSAFNGSQGLLIPRSTVNATTAVVSGSGTPLGDSITKGRIQVPTSDVVGQPAGTRFFAETVMLLPDDAQYVLPHQQVAVNAMNNASSQEININGGTASPTLMGAVSFVPALAQWQAIDPAVTVAMVDLDDAANPSASFPGTTIRARFVGAVRTTSLGDGLWRYEYAVYNLNSDRSAGSFTVPMPSSAPMTAVSFHAPASHSGELYSNAAWTVSRSGDTVTFSTGAYASNPNANAIRWGTMYNFGFTTSAPPGAGQGQIGLFKPGSVGVLQVSLPVPTVRRCSADFDADGLVGVDADIEAFFACLGGNCCPTCESGDFNGDGDVATDGDIESFFRVLAGGAC